MNEALFLLRLSSHEIGPQVLISKPKLEKESEVGLQLSREARLARDSCVMGNSHDRVASAARPLRRRTELLGRILFQKE
jgi:hypothetical protein